MSSPPETSATAQAILDATLQVIGEKGLKGATTRAIAQAANVHEVTLFRNFGTKSSLISAAVSQRFARVETESVRYTGDLEADLIRLATTYRNTWATFGPAARVLITEGPLDPDLAGVWPTVLQLLTAVRDLLHRYQQEGKLRSEPADSLLPAFLGPLAMPFVIAELPPGALVPPLDATAHVHGFLYGRIGS